MKHIAALVALLLISGCSKMYSELETNFAVAGSPLAGKIPARTIVISSQKHAGAESYRDSVSIYATSEGISIDPAMPFRRAINIPLAEIAGCSMTCFGTSNQHVTLLIPKLGTEIMIPRTDALLDWCWQNKKPMYPNSDVRNWLYNKAPLPAASTFQKQLELRKLFDEQRQQSCLGY